MAELDQINVATERYIRSNPALVDDVKGMRRNCAISGELSLRQSRGNLREQRVRRDYTHSSLRG